MRAAQSSTMPVRRPRKATVDLMADTVIGDIESLIPGNALPPYASLVVDLLAGALPQVFSVLAGQETAEEIAAPYLRIVFGLAGQAIEDAIAHKPLDTVRVQFDDAIGDLLENIRFGAAAKGASKP